MPRSALSSLLTERGIKPALEIASVHTALAVLRQGKGRAFLPLFMVEEDIQKGLLARIDTDEPESGIYIQMLYNENRWLNPQMQAFLHFILEKME